MQKTRCNLQPKKHKLMQERDRFTDTFCISAGRKSTANRWLKQPKGSNPVIIETDIMLDYYKHQLDLLAQMCKDQQYLAIDPPPERKLLNISIELPADMVLKCIKDDRLPFEIRASFTRLMLHLHVVRGSRLTPVQHARLWRDIPDSISVQKYTILAVDTYVDGSRNASTEGVFKEVLKFVENYLKSLDEEVSETGRPVLMPHPEYLEQNKFTLEVVTMAQALAEYGYYSFNELLQLARYLLAITDSTPKHRHNLNQSSPPGDSSIRRSLAALTRGVMVPVHAKVTKALKSMRSNVSVEEEEVLSQAAYNIILKTKLTVVEILQDQWTNAIQNSIRNFRSPTLAQSQFEMLYCMRLQQHQSTFGKLLQSLAQLQVMAEEYAAHRTDSKWIRVANCMKSLSKFAEDQGITLPANVAMPPSQHPSDAKTKMHLKKALAFARFRGTIDNSRRSLSACIKERTFSGTIDMYNNVVVCFQVLYFVLYVTV